jgi:6-hydroxy-3-succinoylpyridine 3-monooxygenase
MLYSLQQLIRDGCVACPSEARGKKPAKAGFFIWGDTLLRTRIYIDGYNLYYGCLKGTHLKWLDLLALFEKGILPSVTASINGQSLASDLQPVAIKFFTAPILAQAAKADDSIQCQEQYHAALNKHQPGRIETIKGYFSLIEGRAKVIDSRTPKKWPRDCQTTDVWKLEEKQSDVNLALHAVKDALLCDIEHVVIVTNDTDIAPAMQMIRSHTKATVGLVIPTTDQARVPNAELAKYSHWVRTHITEAELKSAQLPRVVAAKSRRPAIKPDSWFAHPDLLQQAIELGKVQLGSRSKVFQWLEKPNPYYDGRSPLDLLESEDAHQVIGYMQTQQNPNSSVIS